MRTIVLILTLTFLTFTARAEKPNILIILSDDQGWADVGFNGSTEIPTPNLDELAREGIRFTQAYASHPYCSPSRAGLLSGRYQQKFGHENNLPYHNATAEDGLPLDEMLLSEVLQKEGYQTCAIGKWHLGDSTKFWPINRGFDDWYGFWGGGMSFWGNTSGRDQTEGILRNGEKVPQDEITYLTDNFSTEAVNYIDQYAKNNNPFFMYLAYNAPHAPMHATTEYLNMVDYIEYGDRLVYSAMVAGMDVGIGKVIDKLKETGEYENTLIVFFSDNGGSPRFGSRNFPFRGHKGMLFEGGIRVPFVITWPEKLKRNTDFHEMISALDIFPTVLAAANISHPKQKKLDGVNLLPYLRGEKEGPLHDVLYWRYSDGAGYAVRKGKYKLVRSGYKNRFFLFDMVNDPYEHYNLATTMPEKVNELKELYRKWNAKTVESKWQDPHAENIKKEEKVRQKTIDKARAGEKKRINRQ